MCGRAREAGFGEGRATCVPCNSMRRALKVGGGVARVRLGKKKAWGGRGVGRVALRVWGERVGAAWRRVRAGGASRERRERRGGCCESALHSN